MFKNMKIKRKLIVLSVIIALVASVPGAVGSVMLDRISTTYDYALINYGFAQGDIGKALAAFCRVDGNVHDVISYFDTADSQAAATDLEKWEQEFDGYMATVEVTLQSDEAKAAYEKLLSDWANYKAKAHQIVSSATSTHDIQVITNAQKRLVNDLDPIYLEVYNGLTNLDDIKVNIGNKEQAGAHRLATTSGLIAIVLTVLAFVMAVVFGTSIANAIARPMQACSKRLKELAGGDLATPVPEVRTKDEIRELADSTASIVDCLSALVRDEDYLLSEMGNGNFNICTTDEAIYRGDLMNILVAISKINSRLSDTLSQINESAQQVAASADQVSTGAQSLAQGATEQASAVEELSATITDISNHAKRNAQTSEQCMLHTKAAGEQVQISAKHMDEMVGAMEKISGSSQEIGKIIDTIENIAFQTNILALNAAVEAARAGAAGKGFAVVADEVRNLASKSDEAAKATKELIEHSVNSVKDGNEIVKNVSASLEKTVELSGHVMEDVMSISKAVEEESESIAQVTEGIDQISSVVQTNSATSEESAAASEELSGQAALMKELMDRFQLRPIESGRAAPSSAAASAVAEDAPANSAADVFDKY